MSRLMQLLILLLVALLVASLWGGGAEEERGVAEYCAMVAIYHEEARRGVPEHDRTGWPPFDGEEACK